MRPAFSVGLLLLAGLATLPAADRSQDHQATEERVLRLEEITSNDLDALDRATTVFVLAFGNMEEHAAHLPVGTDYFWALGVRDRLVARLSAAHPELTFVLFPVIPLGEGGANDVARQFDYPGTIAVRYQTLRDVAADLGSAIARQGFRTILVVHAHGMELHNTALTEAAAFVSEQYKVRMVNLTSLVFAAGFFGNEVVERHLGKDWQRKLGADVHAGAVETSGMLYLRGALVRPSYRSAEPFVLPDVAAVQRVHERSDWPGYFGAPALASAELGRDVIAAGVESTARMAERVLAGEDLSAFPVYPDNQAPLPERDRHASAARMRYDRQAAEIDAWLRRRRQ